MSGFVSQQGFWMIVTTVVACIVTAVLGYPAIPLLKKMKARQSIQEDGLESHKVKEGTPTMGGLFMLCAILITVVVMGGVGEEMLVLLLATVGFGLIGFMDDFIKVVLKRNLGLRDYQKMILLLAMSALLLYVQWKLGKFSTEVWIPIVNTTVDFGGFYVPFILFVIVAMTNSVNLTDGADGLASSVTLPVALVLGIAAMHLGHDAAGIFSCAVAGTCAGFLVHNHYPAKVFMGDTGSLALGGAITAVAILTNVTLILPLVGIIYVIEVLSDILQISVFRATGRTKRILKIAPLHHHLEEVGWSEKKLMGVFASISTVACILGLILMW